MLWISPIISLLGAIIAWHFAKRADDQRRSDSLFAKEREVFNWATRALEATSTLVTAAVAERTKAAGHLRSIIDSGRIFFPNDLRIKDFDPETSFSNGFRSAVLDPLVKILRMVERDTLNDEELYGFRSDFILHIQEHIRPFKLHTSPESSALDQIQTLAQKK